MRTAIEQNPERLLVINRFTFDLNNPSFVDYFEGRTGCMITRCECGWDEVKRLVADPPDITWRICRAKLQDCWNIFTQTL